MSTFYKMMNPDGVRSACVNEKYMDRYYKKGYTNTGVVCGSSKPVQVVTKPPAPVNNVPINTPVNNVPMNNPTVGLPTTNEDVLKDIGITNSGVSVPPINTNAIADISIFALVFIFLLRLIRGIF